MRVEVEVMKFFKILHVELERNVKVVVDVKPISYITVMHITEAFSYVTSLLKGK